MTIKNEDTRTMSMAYFMYMAWAIYSDYWLWPGKRLLGLFWKDKYSSIGLNWSFRWKSTKNFQKEFFTKKQWTSLGAIVWEKYIFWPYVKLKSFKVTKGKVFVPRGISIFEKAKTTVGNQIVGFKRFLASILKRKTRVCNVAL